MPFPLDVRPRLPWDGQEWDVTGHFDVRGRGDRRIKLLFTQFAEKPGVAGHPMPPPFSDGVKAYIRYNASITARKYPPHRDIEAFRAIYVAVAEQGQPDLTLINPYTLDRAIQVLRERVAPSTVSQVGERLCSISRFLFEKRLALSAPPDWKHGVGISPRLMQRVGPEFEARRLAKIPSQDVLDALALAFNLAERPREVVETSIFALLCSAPDRINEVLSLGADCETQADWEGKPSYGLRCRGSKGFHDHTKWIVPSMVDVVREAVRRLKIHTAKARRMAAWYEANPGRLYLPTHQEHLRKHTLLTVDEISEITRITDHKSIERFCSKHGVLPVEGRFIQRGGSTAQLRFEDIEKAIISLLPEDFPHLDKRTNLKFSEALFVVPCGFFRENHPTWSCMFQAVRYDQVLIALAGRDTKRGRARSIFERLGLSTPEHPVGAKTHQFRHWLNTLALKGGLSEWDIAQWSGRKNLSQNRAYDHESSAEIVTRLRQVIGGRGRGAIANIPRNLPVSREAFAEMAIPNAHATALGFCIHDFAQSPCSLFMDCINCIEHVCLKGDEAKTKRVCVMLEQAKSSLQKACEALAENYEGAQEWFDAHGLTVARLEQLLAILTNPEIPVGTVVQLTRAGRYTLPEQAVSDRLGRSAVPPLDRPHALVATSLPGGNHAQEAISQDQGVEAQSERHA